jgi:phenylacetic acid degradation operon negative regulatory protein
VKTKVNPYAAVYSLFGGYVLPRGEEIWIGSLIRALATLNFSENMVRTTVSRMKRTGYLKSRRVGRLSFYRLTDMGTNQVEGAKKLAFDDTGEQWDGCWTLITYSIPETQRALRDTLRDKLRSVGFGLLIPGTWISPYPLPPALEHKFRSLGVLRYLEIFRAEHIGTSDVSTLISDAWPQLPMLANRYLAYTNKYTQIIEKVRNNTLQDDECFALRFQSLFELMTIIIEDPTLPTTLLPEAWPRPAALSVYEDIRHRIAEPAERFFDKINMTNDEIDN